MTVPSLEHHTSTWQKYILAGMVTILFFGICSVYLFLREGSYDVDSINSAAGGASFLLIILILLIGPLTRLYKAKTIDHLMMHRKELGVLAFFLALYHSVYSLIYLPFVYRPTVLPATIIGIVVVLVLAFLFIISRQKIISRLDTHLWWKMQYWGVRIAGILILLHVFILKEPGWARWYNGSSAGLARPFLPPGSLVISVFALFVLGVRILELLLPHKVARIVVPVLFVIALLFLAIPGGFD